MSTIQQLVDTLNSGGGAWKIVGTGQPVEETQTGTYTDPTDPGAAPQVTTRGTGRYYVVVQDDQGHQRALFLKADPIKGALVVPQTGVTDRADPVTGKPPANVYSGDLSKLSWSQAGPVGDVPAGPKEPTATAQLDKLDKNGNDATKSGLPTVSLRDPKTGSVIDLPKDPAGTVTPVGDNFYIVKPDGSSTLVTDASGKPIAKTKDAQQFNVSGIGLVNYDPDTKTATTLIATPKGLQANQLKPEVRNGTTYIPVDDGQGGIAWQEAKTTDGSPLPADVTWTMASNDPRSSVIQLIGSNGESKTIKKEDFHPPPSPQAGQAITPDTTAPFVVTIGDNGQPVFTQNQNRQSISEAQKQLIQQLGGKVADGSMSEDQAKNLIQEMTQAMTAQAAQQNAQANMLTAQTGQQRLGIDAASQALQGVQQGAQTGAGLLQNRVTAATGALNNAISSIAGSKMTSAPSGMGANLVGGLQEWVTQMGGGQPVYDSAAAMVNQANPSVSGNPTVAQQAYTALRGAMDLYKQQTGQDWVPKEQRQFNAPTTAGGEQTPAAATATANLQASAPPVTPPPPPPVTPPSPVVSQNYGPATAYTGGVLPWNAQPGPAIPQLQPLPIPPGPYRAPVTA